MIERLRQREVYANDFVRVYDDDVRFAGGRTGRHLRVVTTGAGRGAVIVVSDGDRFALVQTYRYPIGRTQWGFPRGFAHGTDVEVTVRAELNEELGATPTSVRVLGTLTPDSGLLAQDVWVCHAQVTTTAGRPTDTEEVLDLRWVRADELDALVASGEIDDAFTLAAWCRFRAGVGAPDPDR